MQFPYFECTNEQSRLYVGPQRTKTFSERFSRVLNDFRTSYAQAFPRAEPARIGLIVRPRNGASGYWSTAEPGLGPVFVIEIEPGLADEEHIFAHELMHPVARLRGVPTAKSVGAIDRRIGDEFTSTTHHPFVFDALDQYGYLTEHAEGYRSSARAELARLQTVDFGSLHFTEPPGQTWSALWYFNFYMLARAEYDSIFALHSVRAPGVAQKMDLVRKSWLGATKGREVIKRKAATECMRAFQSHLIRALDLDGRVKLQTLPHWGQWLFQQCPRMMQA